MKAKAATIGELAQIIHGYQKPPASLSQQQGGAQEESVHLLGISGMEAYMAGQPVEAPQVSRTAGALLVEGDLLIQSRGDRFVSYIYRYAIGPAIASAVFLVIRCKSDQVLPEYLLHWLNAPKGQGKLLQIAKGTSMMALSKSDLAQLTIELPDLEVQRQAVTALNHSLATIRLARRILEAYQQRHQQLADLLTHSPSNL